MSWSHTHLGVETSDMVFPPMLIGSGEATMKLEVTDIEVTLSPLRSNNVVKGFLEV